jgi:hypothetical protein
MGTSDVVQFSRAEEVELVTLIFATTIFGGRSATTCTSFGSCEVHRSDGPSRRHPCLLSVGAELETGFAGMEMREYFLPDDIPDATFKRPSWLKRADEQN